MNIRRAPSLARHSSKSNGAFLPLFIVLPLMAIGYFSGTPLPFAPGSIEAGFVNPPDSVRPGVYWYFMDGNLSEESITKDLESMKKAGIGSVVFLEVNLGVPRGPVDFLSDTWLDMFRHAEREAQRLGIEVILGTGPGWAGSGGPWVTAAQSMQHLVHSTVQVEGGGNAPVVLPRPDAKRPYFGHGALTPDMRKRSEAFYEDVAVLAFRTPASDSKIGDIDYKALYYRAPYTSTPNVPAYIPAPATFTALPASVAIDKTSVINLTGKMKPDGTLDWKAPAGKWTIMRFGSRNNGAATRPAPYPGLGFEADKFDTTAMSAHLENYTGKILKRMGGLNKTSSGGLKKLHIDSWEMGAQNWTQNFRVEFTKRRGYDPLPYYPVYAGNIIGSEELSERFLWDLRLTSQELIIENHAGYVKRYSHRLGLKLSIEPYDMNPAADLELGDVADVPMCEFWSKDLGFNAVFSCIEATSIAHVNGINLVPAEAFTSNPGEDWKQHPGSMKDQTDWAFAAGINRLVFHTFQNQYLADKYKPGMSMGGYGVHWDRGQTWWPMVGDYHRYVARSQYLLQQGRTVADILYLTPEGAPHVFNPPPSALQGEGVIKDRKAYNFDGCAPGQLYRATVKDGKVVFPGGASYSVVVMPAFETMTPKLLGKIRELLQAGATFTGTPPARSPGLQNYPQCDSDVKQLAQELWGSKEIPAAQTLRGVGKGKIIWGGESTRPEDQSLYPTYQSTTHVLASLGVKEDFTSSGPVRYTHRTLPGYEIYFVSNRSNEKQTVSCVFRVEAGEPELWDAINGSMRKLPQYTRTDGETRVPMVFEPHQSFFVVFKKDGTSLTASHRENFPSQTVAAELKGAWNVSFDTTMGGPAQLKLEKLADWTLRQEEGIKYYSGIATYTQRFDAPRGMPAKGSSVFLDLGEVKNLARIKLNGKDLGALWTAPWQVDITPLLKKKDNVLEIEVANLWPNRLIGDEQFPYDGVDNAQWPEWYLKNEKRPTKRYTFTIFRPYGKDAPLLSSGLLGPVTLRVQ